MARLYLDTNVYSSLRAKATEAHTRLLDLLNEHKGNLSFVFSPAHIADKKKDLSDFKLKDFAFIESFTSDNHLSYHALKKHTSFYLATPLMVYEDEKEDALSLDEIVGKLKTESSDDVENSVFQLLRPLMQMRLPVMIPPLETLTQDQFSTLSKIMPLDKEDVTILDMVEKLRDLYQDLFSDSASYRALRKVIDTGINDGKYTLNPDDPTAFNHALVDSELKQSFVDFVNSHTRTNSAGEKEYYDFYTLAYNSLDLLGIKKDKITPKNGFGNIINDGLHSYYARYCDYLISDDATLRTKSKALYAMFDCKTVVLSTDEFIERLPEIGKATDESVEVFFDKLQDTISRAQRSQVNVDEDGREQSVLSTDTIYLNHFDCLFEIVEHGYPHYFLRKFPRHWLSGANYREKGMVVNRCLKTFGMDVEGYGEFSFETELPELETRSWRGRRWIFGAWVLSLILHEGLKGEFCLIVSPVDGIKAISEKAKGEDAKPMNKEVFRSALFVGFELVFGKQRPENPIGLLKGIPQRAVLYQIAALNYRLKPPLEKEFKTGIEDQLSEVRIFCGGEVNIMQPYLTAMDNATAILNSQNGGKPVMFSRASSIFAMQDILEHLEDLDHTSFQWDSTHSQRFLHYYLCINDIVSAYKNQEADIQHQEFEKLAAGSGFINELTVVNDPFFLLYRFVKLLTFLQQDTLLSASIADHFQAIGLSPNDFARHIFAMCYFPKDKRTDAYYYKLDPNNESQKQSIQILDYLSRRPVPKKVHALDIIEIKKAPVFKDVFSYYILLDTTSIMEKLYELFLNDFWFDTVKGNGIDIQQFRGRFGLFFQQYASSVIKLAFKFLTSPPVKCLDELKIKDGKGEFEVADIYFREGNMACVGEIKSNGIYAKQKYGTAQSLFDVENDDLYKTFGLYQLVRSLCYIRDIPKSFDPSFPEGSEVELFPVLIVNELIFQTPMLPLSFHQKFMTELAKEKFDNFKIHTLTIIHIADLERIITHISTKQVSWWDLLKKNYEHSLFPKPFNLTLNREKLNPDYSLVKDSLIEFGIIPKEQVEGENQV